MTSIINSLKLQQTKQTTMSNSQACCFHRSYFLVVAQKLQWNLSSENWVRILVNPKLTFFFTAGRHFDLSSQEECRWNTHCMWRHRSSNRCTLMQNFLRYFRTSIVSVILQAKMPSHHRCALSSQSCEFASFFTGKDISLSLQLYSWQNKLFYKTPWAAGNCVGHFFFFMKIFISCSIINTNIVKDIYSILVGCTCLWPHVPLCEFIFLKMFLIWFWTQHCLFSHFHILYFACVNLKMWSVWYVMKSAGFFFFDISAAK